MKYEVLIYAGKEILTALDVDGENIQYISMDGNQSHPADDVNGFYENLLDYFNVDDLSELKAGVRILNGGTSEKNIKFFSEKFIKTEKFSLWRVEEILPIAVLKKNMIDENDSLSLRIYEKCYKVTSDDNFNISIDSSDEANIDMTLEDFTLLNDFSKSNFQRVKELKIYHLESEHQIKELEKKNRESEQELFALKQIVSELTEKMNSLNFDLSEIKQELDPEYEETIIRKITEKINAGTNQNVTRIIHQASECRK